jgi:hypothetical protein
MSVSGNLFPGLWSSAPPFDYGRLFHTCPGAILMSSFWNKALWGEHAAICCDFGRFSACSDPIYISSGKSSRGLQIVGNCAQPTRQQSYRPLFGLVPYIYKAIACIRCLLGPDFVRSLNVQRPHLAWVTARMPTMTRQTYIASAVRAHRSAPSAVA